MLSFILSRDSASVNSLGILEYAKALDTQGFILLKERKYDEAVIAIRNNATTKKENVT